MTDNQESNGLGAQNVTDSNVTGNTAPRKLKITSDLQATAGIPLPAPFKLKERTAFFQNGYEFPICSLVKVAFDPAKMVKRATGEESTPVLTFVFTNTEKKQFTHVIFPVADDDAKFDDKVASLLQGIKHIFLETVGEKYFKDGLMEGEDFAELFANCAKAFNDVTVTVPSDKESAETKTVPLYSRTKVYLKLVYYKDRLQMPLYPNFIQRAFNTTGQVKCELTINPSYDNIEPQAKAKPNIPGMSGTSAGYGGDTDDYPDIP